MEEIESAEFPAEHPLENAFVDAIRKLKMLKTYRIGQSEP